MVGEGAHRGHALAESQVHMSTSYCVLANISLFRRLGALGIQSPEISCDLGEVF